jgi:hypothetical protein
MGFESQPNKECGVFDGCRLPPHQDNLLLAYEYRREQLVTQKTSLQLIGRPAAPGRKAIRSVEREGDSATVWLSRTQCLTGLGKSFLGRIILLRPCGGVTYTGFIGHSPRKTLDYNSQWRNYILQSNSVSHSLSSSLHAPSPLCCRSVVLGYRLTTADVPLLGFPNRLSSSRLSGANWNFISSSEFLTD